MSFLFFLKLDNNCKSNNLVYDGPHDEIYYREVCS